jgi:hypothetical protein
MFLSEQKVFEFLTARRTEASDVDTKRDQLIAAVVDTAIWHVVSKRMVEQYAKYPGSDIGEMFVKELAAARVQLGLPNVPTRVLLVNEKPEQKDVIATVNEQLRQANAAFLDKDFHTCKARLSDAATLVGTLIPPEWA